MQIPIGKHYSRSANCARLCTALNFEKNQKTCSPKVTKFAWICDNATIFCQVLAKCWSNCWQKFTSLTILTNVTVKLLEIWQTTGQYLVTKTITFTPYLQPDGLLRNALGDSPPAGPASASASSRRGGAREACSATRTARARQSRSCRTWGICIAGDCGETLIC